MEAMPESMPLPKIEPLIVSLAERTAYNEVLNFAKNAHAGQVRRYTGEDYWHHPMRVANAVSWTPSRPFDLVLAALLHDVLEDTVVTDQQVIELAGMRVYELVLGLTFVRYGESISGNRAERKRREREYYLHAIPDLKTIKTADVTDNLRDVWRYDPKFLPTRLWEIEALLPSLVGGSQELLMPLAASVSAGLVKHAVVRGAA